MNNRGQRAVFITALVLIGFAAGALAYLHGNQRLGKPGVRTSPSGDTNRLQVVLPEWVLDFSSEQLPVQKLVLDFLPKDTSFGQRHYKSADGFETLMNVVLMGTDRTSLHKPQFCLTGSGWNIDYAASSESVIHVERPVPYDLPVMKLVATKMGMYEGRPVAARGVYVYWFVADGAYTARHLERMWWMAKTMVTSGVLQRWAYVSCFAMCNPGQEDATFERMKRFIAAAVPEFQLTPQEKPGTTLEARNR